MNGVTILFVYAVIMILATVILTKKEKNVERFCVGSRSENWLMSALSIAATWIWAPALFVSTEKAYSTGWVGLFWFLVPNALCLVIFIPFAKKIRKEMPEGMTLSGYMKEKYQSDGVKRVYLFQLIGLSVLSTGVQLLAGSQILSEVTGISFKTMTILLACIAISYSLFSGIKASMLTDAIQMVFMLVACSLFVIFGVRNTGTQGIIQGLSGISGDCTTLFSGKGVEIFLAFGLPTTIGLLSGPFGDQSFWQRAFAVKKEKLGRAFLFGAVLFAVVPLSMGILGFMGAGAGYQAQNLGIINFELIRHFFLVGGCDGARPGRNYYTEFVKQTPPDTMVLTLACGKFRFNDLDLGTVAGLPRILDIGQCNDAYSAIQIALALADAFGCGVNELPLSMVLSWYEQKAVCILLTLLYLGIKDIRLGPTLPAFLSPNVLDYLVKNFGIAPITTPEEDLKAILG